MPKPLSIFYTWYAEAEIRQPNCDVMMLATANAQGQPAVRAVLYKGVIADSLIFYTNYHSRKAQDINENSKVAIAFYWPLLEKQVRIEGCVSVTTRKHSELYFASRPKESQINAWASPQSQSLTSREQLLSLVAKKRQEYSADIPCPSFWGGYSIAPHSWEFWRLGPNRLHEREAFSLNSSGEWQSQILAP